VQLSQRAEAAEEFRRPRLASGFSEHGGGERKGEEGSEWGRAHCGKVAQAACEAAMAYRLGRVGVAAEVSTLKRKVRGDKYFASGGRAKDCAIVANAELYRAAVRGEVALDLLDES
jgi:hypothetical protein